MPVKKLPRAPGNLILDSLPPHDAALISADLTAAELSRNQTLFEGHPAPENIYFPIDSSISVLGETGDGGRIEVWSVGREGAVGLSCLLGGSMTLRRIVQLPGRALVGVAANFRRHFKHSAPFHDAVLRYYNSLLLQVSYLSVCNSSHSVHQRFCRWLLMVSDRSGQPVLNFTQDYIAGVLGTRRATISEAAADLQNAKLIRYTPGSITIKSRKGLQFAACHCYRLIRSGFEAVKSGPGFPDDSCPLTDVR